MEQSRCACFYTLGKRITPPFVYCPAHDERNQPKRIEVTYNKDSWRIEILNNENKSIYGESGDPAPKSAYTPLSSKVAAMKRVKELYGFMEKTPIQVPVSAEYVNNLTNEGI